jgi:sulfate transport system ATP-binding protein
MTIALKGIGKRFRDAVALRDIDLEVANGELIALLGPSGSGKTTLLRIIAGLEWADTGGLRIDGQDALNQSVRDRHIGFVFQHYALFRHMSVAENVAFGLRVQRRRARPAEAEIKARVANLLNLVQIGDLGARYPHQISGGQRQRVALARALAIEPSLLLLDEPFGALDAKVRKELRRWLRHLHEQLGMTTLFVTHDQEEALELADRVVVMGKGRIEQVGTPEEVYANPANAFVYDFLGEANRIPVEMQGGQPKLPGIIVDRLDGQRMASGKATLFVRPHDVMATRAGDGSATVRDVSLAGPFAHIEITLADGTTVDIAQAHHLHEADRLKPGDPVSLRFRRAALFAG